MSHTSYTGYFWDRASDIYEKILELPLNRELAAGTLDRETFIYYMKQDALSLADYGRALTMAGTRSGDTEVMQHLLGSPMGL